MVRQAVCDPKFEKYLAGLDQSYKLSIGLLIGQISPNGKDLIVHLARTPIVNKESETHQEPASLSDIENSQVAEHALNAQRMIVGGFNILGLFVVSEKNIMSDNGALQKLKTVLMDIKSTLESNGLLYANTDDLDKGDKLLLNYVSGHKNFICKTVSTDPSKSAATNPVDLKFAKGTDWQEFETLFEIDTLFPLPHANNHFDTEKNVMATIDLIAENLNSSLIFFNGQPLDKELTLEKVNKQNKSGGAKVKVTIFSEASKLAKADSGKLSSCSDLVSYTGIISSKVFGSSRNTISEIESFIRQDIIRSLTTRMQIYYDALLANDDGGNDGEAGQDEEVNSTTPPRRVFYQIGNDNILFCDYLFQHETEETTVKQSMDVLGIKLAASDVNSKAEYAMQLNISGQENVSSSSGEALSTKDTGRLLLILGVIGALAALVVAVILHFLLK